MPIYSYRCEACGHAQDVLQKMSDPTLIACPSCGASAFKKQVTAAGFHLKGSGWYASDFRNPPAKTDVKGGEDQSAGKESAPAEAAAAGDKARGSEKEAASPASEKAAAPAGDASARVGSSRTPAPSSPPSSTPPPSN